MVQNNSKHPCKGGQGVSIREEDVTVEGRKHGGRDGEKFEEVTPLDFQMEEGAMSPGMQEASRRQERQGDRLFPRAPRRNQPADTLN